jgi:O-antigen/teichoic acid export membrane protein
VSDVFGAIIYTGVLIHDLRKQEIANYFDIRTVKFPVKEIFSFSAPMVTTTIVYLIRSQLVVVILEYFRSTLDVAAYRAVQPVADLNTTVIQTFAVLFMPMMARLFAKNDQNGIDDLYWQSAIWITVITFPVFLVTFSLAEPLTILLFGQRYAQSSSIMALLAIGYYFNAALGFNADTLRIYGKLGYTVFVDFLAMMISVGLTFILIPRYGAIGAAMGTCGTLIIYNILNHLGLKFTTPVNPFKWNYWKVYAGIVLGTLSLAAFQRFVSPSFYLSLVIAGLISLLVLFVNRSVLNVEQIFPELLRFPIMRFLFTKSEQRS